MSSRTTYCEVNVKERIQVSRSIPGTLHDLSQTQHSRTMMIDSKRSPTSITMSLTSMLLNSDANTAPTDVAVSDGIPQVSGRELLLRAMLKNDDPAEIPHDYILGCLQKTDSLEDHFGMMKAYDSILERHFLVAPISPTVDISTRHSNLQRVYGYSEHFLVLEAFSKGTVADFLATRHGRIQLNAQRRISIMLSVAQVLALRKFPISSSKIGMDNRLNPKVMRFDGASNVCDFGILMVELLTGSLQNDGSEDRRFGDFTERYTTKGHLIEDDLDPYVRESWTFNILSQLIELALKCFKDDEKPNPEELVEMLTLISSRMRVVDNYDYY